MRGAVFVLRAFVTLAFLSIIAAIWLPEHRWQWLVTAIVLGIGAGMTSVAIDETKSRKALEESLKDGNIIPLHEEK